MKRFTLIVSSVLLFAVVAFGQTGAAGKARSTASFPGVSAAQLTQLQSIKNNSLLFPLPSWLPEGFRLETIDAKLGAKVPLEEKVFRLNYSKKLPSGKFQRFSLEAGFEGLGDVPYETTHTVRAPVGIIYLMYEPLDLDEGRKKIRDYAITQWFSGGGKFVFIYNSGGNTEQPDRSFAMISLSDTQRILRSLKRF